jgi:hypothetical protein
MGLPDLAQERPEVYDYLLKTSQMWIDAVKPDGFRLDAVKHIAPAFWQKYNADIHKYAGPGFFLLGEDLDGDPAHLAKTVGNDGFDAMFDFPLYFATRDVFCKDAPLGGLAAILSLDRTYPAPSSLVTLVDNHDLPRIATACDGDAKRIDVALEFSLAMRGIPSMTYGTEAGLTGEREPQNRGDMRFVAIPERAALIRKIMEMRKAHPELADGKLHIESFDSTGFEFARVGAQETAHVQVTRVGIHFKFDTQRSRPPSPRRVMFHLAGAKSPDAVLVGAGPELGSWKPEAAPGLINGSLNIELPSAAVYEFKFATRGPGGKAEWESRADRFLFVPPGTEPLRVEATWGGT